MVKVNLSTNETIDLCEAIAVAIVDTLNKTGRYDLKTDEVFSQLFSGDYECICDFVEGVINEN